jgi:ABC-type branched-subunit amino acid transport system substrate-binding protein
MRYWAGGRHSARQANTIPATAIALALAVVLGGCGDGNVGPGGQLTVYVSLPLRGSSGTDGRDAMRGAKLALADAGGRAGDFRVGAVYLDDTSGSAAGARWDAARVGANARRATEDSTVIAYVGELESGATRTSLPITNSARLLQVSPASSAVDLVSPFPGSEEVPEDLQTSGERTFGRVVPDDGGVGEAKRAWADGHGATEVDVLYPGAVPGSVPRGVTRVVSAAQDPLQLPPVGQAFVRDFERRYGDSPGRYAAYGYEAMAVVLDSIDRAGGSGADRQAVIDAFFETEERNSILGTYSIDEIGNTTLDRLAGYLIEHGRPVFEEGLRVP